MQAPSPLCLQALRHITLLNAPPICYTLSRRNYASIPSSPKKLPQPQSPQQPPPPPPTSHHLPPQPNHLKPSTTEEEANEDHTPRPLSRPIGMPLPPQSGENTGLDTRSIKQRRDDFVDYEQHLARRAKMTKQIAKPYFRDWSNLRFSKGKGWRSNERLFRGEYALFFPNLFGRVLRKGGGVKEAAREGLELGKQEKLKGELFGIVPAPVVEGEKSELGRKDGYGGLGRNTSPIMYGRVSVVSFVSNAWAVDQVKTFCDAAHNPALHAVLAAEGDIAQRVEINYENNLLKWWILRLFGLRGLRRERTLEQQERYFIVRRGVSEIIKEAIGLLNDKVGYVYLVDPECRIRWAGSAIAEEGEKESLVRGVKKLVAEAREVRRGVAEKVVLEDTVAEVVDEGEKNVAVG